MSLDRFLSRLSNLGLSFRAGLIGRVTVRAVTSNMTLFLTVIANSFFGAELSRWSIVLTLAKSRFVSFAPGNLDFEFFVHEDLSVHTKSSF